MYVRMSWIGSKGRPLTSRKRVGMDTVFRRERHRLLLVRLRHLPRPGAAYLCRVHCWLHLEKWRIWSKSVGENSGKRKWPWFKMNTPLGFWADGFMANVKGLCRTIAWWQPCSGDQKTHHQCYLPWYQAGGTLTPARGHVFVGPVLGCICKKWEFLKQVRGRKFGKAQVTVI